MASKLESFVKPSAAETCCRVDSIVFASGCRPGVVWCSVLVSGGIRERCVLAMADDNPFRHLLCVSARPASRLPHVHGQKCMQLARSARGWRERSWGTLVCLHLQRLFPALAETVLGKHLLSTATGHSHVCWGYIVAGRTAASAHVIGNVRVTSLLLYCTVSLWSGASLSESRPCCASPSPTCRRLLLLGHWLIG